MSEENKEIYIDEKDINQKKEAAGPRVICFSLSSEFYCVEVDKVREVVRVPSVTRVPNTPQFIMGVFNLRGDVITLIDIRHFFGLTEQVQTDQSRVVVTDVGGLLVSFLVDSVVAVLDINEEDIQSPLTGSHNQEQGWVVGQVQHDDQILTILDLEKVMNNDQIKSLEQEETV